jgi:hypothetical protein
MKPLILYASNTEASSSLKSLIAEANQKGFIFTPAILFKDLLNEVKKESSKIILINAEESKLEALELCRSLKSEYKGSVKVFVYMSQSSASEGSRFGLLNAEVEDENSIKLFCDKLFALNNEYIIDENITCFASLSGSSGASFTSIALASMLEDFSANAILLENSANFALRDYLSISTNLSLLGGDLDDNKLTSNDLDWFKSFIYKSDILETSLYLNLFNDFKEKYQYNLNNISFLGHLASELRSNDINKTKNNAVADSLELLEKDFQGKSFSLFNEVIGLGSKLTKNFFIDIGSDFYSSLNLQFLHLAKNCVVFFRDNKEINSEFKALKNYLQSEFALKLIPVILTDEYNFKNYEKLKNHDWQEILGTIPLIMPPVKDAFDALILRNKKIYDKKYLAFLQNLAIELGIKLNSSSYNPRGILKFLNIKERFSLNA